MRPKMLVGIILLMVSARVWSGAQAVTEVPTRARQADFGRLPLTFEMNAGQTSPEVSFLSRGSGYTAYLTAGSMVLSLRTGGAAGMTNPSLTGRASVQLSLVDAASTPAVVGENAQPGKVNYFLGNDPTQWHTNVPTYGRVRYKNVYPGIDLVYYGSNYQLEYDFEIQPGADPRKIQLAIQGASQIRLDTNGDLVLQLANGQISLKCPVVYQQLNGQRVAIDGAYEVADATHIAFRVSNYDSTKPLIIDPVLSYATYLGGSGMDQPAGIAVDSSGNVYVAGYTDSVGFPATTFGAPASTVNHVYVAKLDPTGSTLIYADYIGGNNEDYAAALVLDNSNNVYVTGGTESSNFPVVSAYQTQQPGPYTGFLTKVSASGSALLYSTYLGGNAFDQPTSIAIDSLSEVHVAGYTMSQNFPESNAYQSTVLANQGGVYGIYGFLTKFSADGSSLVYSTYFAGNSVVAQNCGSPCWPAPYNAVSAIAIDANDAAYVAGTTNTSNFPATSGAYLTSNSTQQDSPLGFVAKFNSAGGLGYSTYLYGSSGNPVGINGIAVDGSGSAYITGTADSDGTFPITSTSICNPAVYGFGCSSAFVTKFDPAGATLLYSTFLGPNNYATPAGIALDSTDDAYVVASTSSPSFQTNDAIEAYTNNGDVLLVEIDPGATTQLFSTYLGGSGNDTASAIAIDAASNIYLTGSTDSTDFPVSQGAFQSVLGGSTDAFIARIASGTAPTVSLTPGALQYASQTIGSTSPTQQVQFRNTSSMALTISSISTSGDFAEADNCGTSLVPAGSCTLSVTFTPTAVGSRTGALTITDNAAGSPQSVTLSGIGSGSVIAALTPATLAFPGTLIGVSSGPQSVTLANQGTSGLNISSIQITGDYSQTNNCGSSLPAGSSCTFNITFTPTVSGSRTGTLTISDNASSSPQTVALSGSGLDFGITSAPSSVTVKAGGTATYTLTVSPVGGSFGNAIQLACSGAPALTTCGLSASSVTPGANAATVTLTISTTGTSAEARPLIPGAQPVYAVWMQLQGLGLFGMLLAVSKQRRRKYSVLVVLVLLIAALLFMTGCAGGTGIAQTKQTGTTPGTYTITVTGTSGNLQHSVPLTLIVQ